MRCQRTDPSVSDAMAKHWTELVWVRSPYESPTSPTGTQHDAQWLAKAICKLKHFMAQSGTMADAAHASSKTEVEQRLAGALRVRRRPWSSALCNAKLAPQCWLMDPKQIRTEYQGISRGPIHKNGHNSVPKPLPRLRICMCVAPALPHVFKHLPGPGGWKK